LAKLLIVGGTGSIGGYIALQLRERGDEVTLAARRAPASNSPLATFPLLRGDFSTGDFGSSDLRGFDALIFAAANDVRQLRPDLPGAEVDAHFDRINAKAVPEFFRKARLAGIGRAAYIGSFYPQVRPDLCAHDSYVRSRRDGEVGGRAEAGPDFHVVSLNAPIIVGGARGLMRPKHRQLGLMALGRMPEAEFAIPGGSNFMSVEALYQAVLGALGGGEKGRGYLVGGQNLSFRDYLQLYFRAAGREVALPLRSTAHPILGDVKNPAEGDTISYAPEGVDVLGYDPDDLPRAVADIVAQVREEEGA